MKKPVKQQEKKVIREKKKRIVILTALVLAATALFMGIWLFRRTQPTGETVDYNTYATITAYGSGKIGQQDILILNTITRTRDGDSIAEFYIYRLPTGANAQDYLDKNASEIGDSLEKLGNASCTFIDDNPAAVHDLSALFLR